ncbi:MAG: hypothetical protein IJ419_13740 [Agathobacter sp.]|nr:hypothetical protein [Agathobacter sp.]
MLTNQEMEMPERKYDHVLTNFTAEDLPRYKKALTFSCADGLYISDKAYTKSGQLLENHYSLHSTIRKDRGDFWRLFRCLC